MRFRYAKLTSEHAEQWQALMLEGARDFPLGFLVSVEEVAATSIERRRQILDFGTLRGVFEGESLVGFCGFRPQWFERTRHRAEIGPFFVAGSHQGSGAARVLIEGVIEEARESGIEQLELFVDTENHRAIAFYERQGFERIALHPDGVRIDGVPRDGYFYRLRVAGGMS
jgi:RimJ/RimL family protein N-acetyltransferase